MKEIKLEGRVIESHKGKLIDTAPPLYKRYKNGEGMILSEGDLRLLAVRNIDNDIRMANGCWDTSTFLAKKGDTVKIILPYETGSRKMTPVAEYCMKLINPRERLSWRAINLDIGERWERINGKGVYTRKLSNWYQRGRGGWWGKDWSDFQKPRAKKCPLILTKLGHQDYVDLEFSRPKEEVQEIINKTFLYGPHGDVNIGETGLYNFMMAQYLPIDHSHDNVGRLRVWHVTLLNDGLNPGARHSMNGGARSIGINDVDTRYGNFAFERFRKPRSRKKKVE
jgi:hypothetical protein